jgi:hypothetical protein
LFNAALSYNNLGAAILDPIKPSARRMTRARILLKADDRLADEQIVSAFATSM